MILTVGNVKGGVGKTTLAVNIAITRALAGRDVLLVDGDEQGTAARFVEQAGQDPKAVAELAALARLVAALYDGDCISE